MFSISSPTSITLTGQDETYREVHHYALSSIAQTVDSIVFSLSLVFASQTSRQSFSTTHIIIIIIIIMNVIQA
jgi:hypothetical protein